MDSDEKLADGASAPQPGFIRKHVRAFHPIDWVRNHVDDLKVVFKLAASPTLVVALIESNYWVNYFKEFMYIMAILAHACTTPGFPRAQLIMFNFRLLIMFALAYCWALLGGYCAVQARMHRGEMEPYSASAATILAIFLMFGCWCSYAGRSRFPKWTMAYVLTGIFLVASIPGLVELRTMEQVIDTASLILECFLVGQAIGAAIGLVIFPKSSRTVYMESVENSLLAFSAVIKGQPRCLERLVIEIGTGKPDVGMDAVKQVKVQIGAYTGAVCAVHTQLEHASQEWTYSHFSRGDLKMMSRDLTMINAPIIGLRSLADKVLDAMTQDWTINGETSMSDHRDFVVKMKEFAEELTDAIDGGIQHALSRLGTRSKKAGNADEACLTGQCQHIANFETTLSRFRSMQGELTEFAESYLQEQIYRDTKNFSQDVPYGALVGCFLSSHMILLLSAAGYEFHNLLLFLEDVSHKKKRLYTPIQNLGKDIRVWCQELFRTRTASQALYGLVFANLAPPIQHDVDHLPATNTLEKVGDTARKWWKLFDSADAGFGVRGALAVMTIAILAFLKDEHAFYNEQRFLWALFSIILCLDRTAGSSTLRLVFRFLATTLSMVASYVIWYIVDQKVPGIIVFLFLWYCVLSYYEYKSPKLSPIAFTALVAATVMIANQLQVRKIGAANVEKSGQAVYPSYVLFPLRLAQVTLGIFVAYFWTLFPSPLPEHRELRFQTAETLLNLATFNTSVHQSVSIQFGGQKNVDSTQDHLERLRGRHRAHLTEHNMLVGRLQSTMKTLPWEFNLGGRFPIAKYRAIYDCVSRLGDLFVCIAYTSHTLDGTRLAREMGAFSGDVRAHLCPRGIGLRLVVLCGALRSGHPLPPGLQALTVPDLRHFLDKRVATDECFATASLIHSANYMITKNMNELTRLVADVVGTLDFSLPLPELEMEV